MSDTSSDYSYIDYSAIRFPSDQLTVGAMRRVHPDIFDVENAEFGRALQAPPGRFDPEKPRIYAMLYLERLLAQDAYESFSGVFTKENLMTDDDKPGYVEELSNCYVRYGLASGIQHTQQLVRDIETQAAAQARNGKRGPG